jgi:hypothetical protein
MAGGAVHRYRRVCEALTMGDNAFNEALTAKRAREYTHQNALALTPRQEAIRSAVGNAFASMIPGVGDVMDAREGYDTLREAGGDFERGDYLSGIGNTLSGAAIGASALIPFLGMGGIKRAAENVGEAVNEGRKGIRAYHGSPHDFDRFSMDKIGTGEGAQAYGHGLYFAQQEDVARGYRDRLTDPSRTIPGRYSGADITEEVLPGRAGRLAKSALGQYYERPVADAIRGLENNKKYVVQDDVLPAYDEAIEFLRKAETTPDAGPGRMYEVNIDADEADFLDWDAPLSGQSERVRERLGGFTLETQIEDGMSLMPGAKLRIETDPDLPEYPRYFMEMDNGQRFRLQAGDLKNMVAQKGDEVRGNNIVSTIARGVGGERAATDALREAGIPGIKYKDAGSRGVDGVEASRNFVVFDDKLVSILRKYGVAGLLAAGLTAQQAEQFVAQYEGQPGGGI